MKVPVLLVSSWRTTTSSPAPGSRSLSDHRPRSAGETAGTVAVRVPDHDGTRELLRQTGPLAVSSANVSGSPAAVTCGDAQEQLGDRVAVYLDGGQAAGGVASTIVDFAAFPEGKVLRLGALSMEQLHAVVPTIEAPAAPEPAADEATDTDAAAAEPATDEQSEPQLTEIEPADDASSDD